MKKLALYLGLSALIWSGCTKNEPDPMPMSAHYQSSDVANQYFKLSLQLTQHTPGYVPPVAARAFGYLGVTLYQSVLPSMSDHLSLEGKITDLSHVEKYNGGRWMNVSIAANAAMSEIMRKMYHAAPAMYLSKIDSLEAFFNLQYRGDESFDEAVAFGKAVAEDVYGYSLTDGQDQASMNISPASYIAPTGPGMWVPTPPAYKPALLPYWGNVRTFAPANASMPLPAMTVSFDQTPGSAFYQTAREVYDVAQTLTPEQRVIALYWSDDPGKTATPPGHSMSVLIQMLENKQSSLAFAAGAYAKMGMAMHDAFVCCWKCKYHYNLVRPVTFIRSQFDSNFNTLLETPPFPEYQSGHSVQVGAASAILIDLFGDVPFTDKTHAHRTDINGQPRSFASISQMAQEAGISRLYGGIHYREAINSGIPEGGKVGKHILELGLGGR